MLGYLMRAVIGGSLVVAASAGTLYEATVTGQIDEVLNTPPAPFAGVQVGDAFSYSYQFLDDAADQNALADFGDYDMVSHVVSVGGAVLAGTSAGYPSTFIQVNAQADWYMARALLDVPTSLVARATVDFTDDVFTDVSLPPGIPFGAPSDPTPNFTLAGAGAVATGPISSWTIVEVPEPMTAVLLVMGLGIALRRR